MVVVDEVNFPRGGGVDHGNNYQPDNRHLVFDHVEKKKKRSKKKQVETYHAVTGPQPKLTAVEDLSYKVMTEGMLVLGFIKDIHDHFVEVTLPGLTGGRVPITNISDPYTQLLQDSSQKSDTDEELHPLYRMFFKGQLVTASISNILQSDYGKHEVSLSLNPRALHSEWSHTTMAQEGLIITAAVRSIEEHGYVMDCGVNSLRCFLKGKDAETYCKTFHGGRSLVVGQLVRCLIIEAESNSSASKILVTADPAAIAKQEAAACLNVTVQQLLPGMCFELAVLQELKGGIKTSIINLEGVDGFVHNNHLPSKYSASDETGGDISPGSKCLGRLLYITPLIKTPYFSLLPPVTKAITKIPKPSRAEQIFPIGTTINRAEICEVSGKGIILLLQKRQCQTKGFVPLRRTGFSLKRAEEEKNESSLEIIRNHFPIGTTVKCRVLHFDCLSNIFICSMEKHILQEKYLTLYDINVGDTVPCVVQEIKNGGIIVQVGMLTGFVPAAHTADIPLQHPELKFQPGMEVKGRVMKIDLNKHRMIITFKQSLISCDSVITAYNEAQKGVCSLGTVVAVVPKGVFVSFFGGIKGFLHFNSSTVPEGQRFSVGQVLKCYVIKCKEKQIRLSLFPHPISKPEEKPNVESLVRPIIKHEGIKTGHQYSLEVISIETSGLTVKVVGGDVQNGEGFIPALHLSDDPRLASLLCETYEVGSLLENVWCYRSASRESYAIFSLRPTVAHFFESPQGHVLRKKSFEAISEGWIIPCTVEKILPDRILLQVPLSQFSDPIPVERNNICNTPNDTVEKLGLVEGQGIQAKILRINHKKRSLSLGCSLKHVWDGELESCAVQLLEYLKNQKCLLQSAKKRGDPLGLYSTGDEVSGVVKKKTAWGLIMELNNGVRGEATFFNTESMDLKIGAQISGRVLFVDCLRRHVEICLSSSISATFETELDTSVPKIEPPVRLRGSTLLVTPEFILVLVKWSGKRLLSFVPTQMYPFIRSPLMITEPYFGLDRKLICKSVLNEHIVCLPMEVVRYKEKEDKKKAKLLERHLKQNKYNEEGSCSTSGESIIAPEDIKKEKDSSDSENENSVYSYVPNDDNEIAVDFIHLQSSSKRKIDKTSHEEHLPPKKTKADSSMMESNFEASKLDEEVQPIKTVSSKSKKQKRTITSVDNLESECINSEEPHEIVTEFMSLQSSSRRNNYESFNEEHLPPKKTKTDSNIMGSDFEASKQDDEVQPIKIVSSKSKKQERSFTADDNLESKCFNSEESQNREKDKHPSKTEMSSTDLQTVSEVSSKNCIEDKVNNTSLTNGQTSWGDSAPSESHKSSLKEHSSLKLKSPGFLWNVDPKTFLEVISADNNESSSDDDDNTLKNQKAQKKTRKKSAAERREAAKAEEERLQKIEQDLMDPNRQPTSCDDFDKMVLADPNNSAVWLQYMAFHMQSTEIEKARAVAQRAIKTINYREEQEKLNVWLGLLNLENLYGTPNSLSSTLHQALQYNDPYKVRVHMISIYAESGKFHDLDNEVKLVTKKFKDTPGMWLELGSILMNNGQSDRARKILDLSLPHLKNKKDSTALVVQFALLEARHNNLERAKALLESLLASYPQRVDVWLTYCDLLVKADHIDEARQLLERCVNLKLPARKMKTLFAKFLKFEEVHGKLEDQERVRKLAVEYVNQVTGVAE